MSSTFSSITTVTMIFRPERIGQEMIEVINKGKNGSLWVIENNVPAYEVVVPHYRTMTK